MTDGRSLLGEALEELAATVRARVGADPATSYTARLLAGGPRVCAKKLGEEGVEVALAIAGETEEAVAAEAADLLYHLVVALQARGVSTDDVARVLAARQGLSGLTEKARRADGA